MCCEYSRHILIFMINPTIIMISLPGYGGTGPWKDYTAFAYPIEEMAGFPQITGYPDGPPLLMGHGGGDGPSGIMGAFAVLAALQYRQRTGKGQHIDLSQCEAVTCLMGEAILDYTMNQRVQGRRGNRHPFMAPHGCYQCQGEDKWVTIAVGSDDEWKNFCQAIGNPSWTGNEKFSSALGRWQNQDELDRLIGEWTKEYDPHQFMTMLQGAGIPCGVVQNAEDLFNDPQLREREHFRFLQHQVMGECAYNSPAYRLSKTPNDIKKAGPCLGEDNEYVYTEILGYSYDEITDMLVEGVITTDADVPDVLKSG